MKNDRVTTLPKQLKKEGVQVLNGQVIAITGASSGIGADLARLLAARGARVLLMARSESKLTALAEEIGDAAEMYVLDVTSDKQVTETMEKALRRHRRIDVLVNNAGYGEFKTFLETGVEDFQGMMDVNFMGTVRCTKAVLPAMLREKSGQIVNVASMAGKVGSAKSTAYSATKHAVLGFTNSLRQELAGTGIVVSAVNPGPVDTPFFDRADPSGTYRANLPGWFMLSPEAAAGAVLEAILRKKREINVPRMANAGVRLFLLFPGLFDRLAGRFLNRK